MIRNVVRGAQTTGGTSDKICVRHRKEKPILLGTVFLINNDMMQRQSRTSRIDFRHCANWRSCEPASLSRDLFICISCCIVRSKSHILTAVFLELPIPIVERADLPCLEPSRDAMEVEGVVANTPSHCALLARCGCLVCLTLDAKVHDVISADSAIVHDDVPRPESNGVPLLDLKSLLAVSLRGRATLLLGGHCRYRGVCHINVGHIDGVLVESEGSVGMSQRSAETRQKPCRTFEWR